MRAARAQRKSKEWACLDCGAIRPWSAHAARVSRCRPCAIKHLAKVNKEKAKTRRSKLALQLSHHIASGKTLTDAAKLMEIGISHACNICKEFDVLVIKPRPKRKCRQCGEGFHYYPSQNKVFCSYQCHLESGGARRAGDAAAMARLKYGAKKDANHNEIFDAMRKITAVRDLSGLGMGCPDGIAYVNGGWQLFDVKNPETRYGKKGLNNRQKEWADDWRGGPVFLIYSIEEAVNFVRGHWDGIKREGGDHEDLSASGDEAKDAGEWQAIGDIAKRMTRGSVS